MEKKFTQRIIGLLVLSSLVVIALPLFFGKREGVPSGLTEAPQVASETTPETSAATPVETITPAAVASTIPPTTEVMTPIPPAATTEAKTPASVAPATVAKVKSVPEKAPSKEVPTPSDSVDLTPALLHSAQTVSHPTSSPTTTRLAWIVQMGSFKNKENAKRLTNRLRAAGFKAFMHTVKKGNQERTRVWIGPEYKQAAAEKTSKQVSQAIHMQGFILPYKPLVL